MGVWKRRRTQLNRHGYAVGQGVESMGDSEWVERHQWVRTDENSVASFVAWHSRHEGHAAQDAFLDVFVWK